MGRSGHLRALEPRLELGCGGTHDGFRILPAQTPGRRRMTAQRAAAGRLLIRLLVAIGFIVVFATVTPIDRWWAHAYSGPIEQPRGDVLILLSAAADSD